MTETQTPDIYMIDNAGRLLRKGEHIGNFDSETGNMKLLPEFKTYTASVTRWVRETADKQAALTTTTPLSPVEVLPRKLTPAEQEEADNKGIAKEAQEEAEKARALYRSDVEFATKNNIPQPPKKNPQYGDKTPAFVEWLQKYRPDEFAKRFGVKHKGKAPIWKTNPETGAEEMIGYKDADFATRKTHLTEKIETESGLGEDMDWNA